MNDKSTTTPQAPESTPSTERKPLVLRRQVVKVLTVKTGVAAGCRCLMMSKPG